MIVTLATQAAAGYSGAWCSSIEIDSNASVPGGNVNVSSIMPPSCSPICRRHVSATTSPARDHGVAQADIESARLHRPRRRRLIPPAPGNKLIGQRGERKFVARRRALLVADEGVDVAL